MERIPRSAESEPQLDQQVSESELRLTSAEAKASLSRDQAQKLGQEALKPQDQDTWTRNSLFVYAETEPDYNDDISVEELAEHPERGFNVNPDRFPILRDQAYSNKVLDINETLSIMVQDTADTIAVLTGETDPPTRPSEAVIYLDKSARPVSWLVNEMWEDFTDAPRPEYEGFLAIDRLTWFRAVGLNIDGQGNLKEPGLPKATYEDFAKASVSNPIPRSDIARARLALIPDGIEKLRAIMTDEELTKFDAYNPLESESREHDRNGIAPELPEWIVDKIFSIPTGLEGKKITVIDEVANSKATSEIAKEIVRRAIGSANTEIKSYIFWHAGFQKNANGEDQMQSTPVWYDHDVNPELGKGIGDVNFQLMREEFAKNPDLPHLESLYIAPFRGRSLDMGGQEGESSVELQKEFQRLAKIYRENRILMAKPYHYDLEKWIEHYENAGLVFTPDPKVKNSYTNIKSSFNKKSR